MTSDVLPSVSMIIVSVVIKFFIFKYLQNYYVFMETYPEVNIIYIDVNNT